MHAWDRTYLIPPNLRLDKKYFGTEGVESRHNWTALEAAPENETHCEPVTTKHWFLLLPTR